MDNLTSLIKTEIKKQYKSVRQFSKSVGIPQSTIISALRKGIGGTAFDSVLKICDVLNIKLSVNSQIYIDQQNRELIEAFSKLDAKGKHAVETVCQVELLRCLDRPIVVGLAAAYSGLEHQTLVDSDSQKDAVDALRAIKENQ